MAYPTAYPGPDVPRDEQKLRDWFAGQALCGICAEGAMRSPEDAAKWAYQHADSMLKAREGEQS